MYLRFRKYLALLLATPILAIGAVVCTPAQAAICFLPDCGDQTSTTNPNVDAEKCRNEGYESYQNRVCHQYSIVEFCPYNSDYIKCNNKEWCTINDYTKTECEEPYELFDKCPNGELMYKECKMNMEEACKAEDPTYTDTCPAGWVIDPEDHCSFSEDYGHCCNTCPGFISEEELGDKTAVASCDSCDGKKYIAADDGFNMCEGYWDCQDGCAPDAKTCVSFGITKCDKCNRCESRCTHETCPENAICEYEACTWRYCIIGCPEGYTNYCEAPFTSNCDLLGYTSTPNDCNGSTMLECPFDDNRVMCVNDDGSCCEVCADFPDETIKPGYIATDTCTCCGKKKYKTTINPCSGYKECTYGGTENSLSCQSGDRLLFQQCKECPNACPGNNTCPEGSICEYDACSETYCAIACKTGYTKYCRNPITDCRTLGYRLGISCWTQNTVKCPYDTDYVFCY